MQQKILLLAANPKDTTPLRLDEEVREISEGLLRSRQREQFQLVQRWAVRPRDMQRAMLDEKPQIVHFSGHGAGEEGLVFEDEVGQTKLVASVALAGLFELFAAQVECVVLNGCYSQVQALAVAQHIPYVIGMKRVIGDRAAIEFAVGFYDALGAGETIEFAYKLGCNAIKMQGITEHLTPVLIQGSRQAPSVQKIRERGFLVAENVIFQDSKRGNVKPKLYQSEREPPSLLPYLPNRDNQETELGNALELLRKQVQPHPLVCIIHGNEFQSHDKFLERLRKVSIPKSLELDPNEAVIKDYCLNWPAGLRKLDELRDRLSKNLADSVLGYSSASLEEINENFCKYPYPIIIHTHLLTEDWWRQGFEILNKLLDFWQKWPTLLSGQKLIICVFVKYQINRQKHNKKFSVRRIFSYLRIFYKRHRYQNINKKISTQVEVLATSQNQPFNRLLFIVLPELTNINRGEAESWVRSEETKQFVGEVMSQKLVNEVKDMFYRWEEETPFDGIPMDDLADELTRLLKLMSSHKLHS